MIKYLYISFAFFSINSCKLNKAYTNLVQPTAEIALESTSGNKYVNAINEEELKSMLYYFSSDAMEGRATGTNGQRKAANYLRQEYQKLGIKSPDSINYFQKIPKDFFNNRSKEEAVNVMGYIEGAEIPEELVVISAHYDHLGKESNGQVNNGADDNGSGTIGIIQMAKAFNQAVKEGNPPKRSILFLHVVGEEIGLYGSRYYTENPIFSLHKTVADLNIDMIGRVDKVHKSAPNYLYIIGSDKISKELHAINEKVNQSNHKLIFDYTFNDDNDPNRFYYRSDHYNFAKNNIPVIFYFNGTHEDYHKITDTADKIDYKLLKKRCEHIFLTAWEIANRKSRIRLD